MLKQDAVRVIAAHRGQAISVATMQAGAPWHDAGQGNGLHIDATACMGSAASLGLGLAVGRPDKQVIVLDGDGSLLMQLGSLVSVAGQQPSNFFHFVFANGLYESSGNQAVPGQGLFSWTALAKASGYREAVRFEDADQLAAALPDILQLAGPVLIELDIARDDAKPRWAAIPMAGQATRLKVALSTN